jgi:NTP pyrophosphatase (non-canonical NTP hydrolase)
MLTNEFIKDCIKQAYACACNHGFHEKEWSYQHMAMLVITELGEAVEADRKGRHALRKVYTKKVEEGGSRDELFERYIKDTVEDELADVVIRICDMCGAYDLGKYVSMESTGVSYLRCGFKDKFSFTELMYGLTSVIADTTVPKLNNPIERTAAIIACVETSLVFIDVLCEQYGIDIMWHVGEKMKYNESRPERHGKSY